MIVNDSRGETEGPTDMDGQKHLNAQSHAHSHLRNHHANTKPDKHTVIECVSSIAGIFIECLKKMFRIQPSTPEIYDMELRGSDVSQTNPFLAIQDFLHCIGATPDLFGQGQVPIENHVVNADRFCSSWWMLDFLQIKQHVSYQVETTEHVQCDWYMHVSILLSNINGTMSAHALVAKWVVPEVASLLPNL